MRRFHMTTVLVMVLGLLATMGAMPCEAAAESLGEPIRVGVIQPLTGECSLWGLPIFRCAEIYAEQINAKGGLRAGGKRHLVEVKGYDNICYLPDEELKMAQKAVLHDKVKYIFGTCNSRARIATARFTTEQKVLTVGYGIGYLSPDYPYTMAAATGTPVTLGLNLAWLNWEQPDVKRVAIFCVDTVPEAQAWYEAACVAEGLEIVYNELYPMDTKDFDPLMTAILATKPDVIAQHGTAEQGAFVESARRLGFTGYILSDDWDVHNVVGRVPAEYVDGKIFSAGGQQYSDPNACPLAREAYAMYVEKYGKKEWAPFAGLSHEDMAVVLGVGIPAADSIDPTDVMKKLYSMSEIDHPILGKSGWGGMEMFGCDYHLYTSVPILGYDAKAGDMRLVAMPSFSDWWNGKKAKMVPVLKKYDLVK